MPQQEQTGRNRFALLYITNRMEEAPESQLSILDPSQCGAALAGRAWRIAAPLAAGLALRGWMLNRLFEVNGDSLIYGGIAKNLLLHGRYGLSGSSGQIDPTLIRLPGYPLLVALCFRIFGMENYFAVCCMQIAVDLATCLLLASFVRQITPPAQRSACALATLWVAVLCPFTASYSCLPLTETPTLFALALTMWSVARFRHHPGWRNGLWFTIAVSSAALLRPDGALAGVSFAPALVFGLPEAKINRSRLIVMASVCMGLALLPFAAWTWRNWKTFHVIEPLAPRLATDPGERANPGWERWVKTWCLDFISTYQIYWNVPDDELDASKLPARAFDSPQQAAETDALARAYNTGGYDLTPEIDSRFLALANQRIASHPLRFYLWLPLGRVMDMWLRPRVENLPIDLDWWVWSHHHAETLFSWSYAALNGAYLLLAAFGLRLRPRFSTAMLAYMALRSALLLTVEAPEARYTLECFPMLFALSGVALYWLTYEVLPSVLKVKASLGRD
jgi:Dolichyl-phosphate-mannose-protein mannosyltransferase